MARYMYAAVVAVFACAALQEVGCDLFSRSKSKSGRAAVQASSKPVDPWASVEHHTCEVYKAPIWEKTYSDPVAMKLVGDSLLTLKEAATDEVCSNTIRSILKFGQTTLGNEDAHYSAGMFLKMLHRILQDIDVTSANYKLTYRNIERVFLDKDARALTLNTIVRSLDLMKEPQARERLFRVLMAVYQLAQPSKEEANTKATVKNWKSSLGRTFSRKSEA